MADALYMNNYALSMQNLTVILDAKATAPNIENTNFGAPVFDQRKVVEENYVYMPVEVAKELALSILYVIGSTESRAGIKVNLPEEKQKQWDAAVSAIRSVKDAENKESREE